MSTEQSSSVIADRLWMALEPIGWDRRTIDRAGVRLMPPLVDHDFGYIEIRDNGVIVCMVDQDPCWTPGLRALIDASRIQFNEEDAS